MIISPSLLFCIPPDFALAGIPHDKLFRVAMLIGIPAGKARATIADQAVFVQEHGYASNNSHSISMSTFLLLSFPFLDHGDSENPTVNAQAFFLCLALEAESPELEPPHFLLQEHLVSPRCGA